MQADFQKLIARGPWVIVVSGAPGSGKSTLAQRLAERMRMIHLERDVVLEHLDRTWKGDTAFSRGKDGVPIYYDLVADMLDRGLSVVADGTIYRGISEAELKDLGTHGRMVNVHCRAQNENQRFIARETKRYGELPEWVPKHVPTLDAIYKDVVDPLDLDCPVIEIDTNADYKPTLDEVVQWLLDL